jgi:hypothetical protein
MSLSNKDYAFLCKDSYEDRSSTKDVMLGGTTYEVIDYYSNSITGYQGVAYQSADSGEVVIASRGTENRWSDIITDAGMVTVGLNVQVPDAKAFVSRVKQRVEEDATLRHRSITPITLTGHSLGGSITQILAYEFNLQGVTFNAYGAVDLGYHVPEGGTQVTNYVRVTDVVSAASRHVGKIVELATPEDIERLKHAGYDQATTAQSLRNPLVAASLAAHSIDNFTPDLAPSALAAENQARARAHSHAIGLFRADVHALRGHTLSLPWELQQKRETATHLAQLVATAALHGDVEVAGKITRLAVDRASHNARHAWDTAANTAMLGVNAIDHAGGYIADRIKDTAQTTSAALDRLGRAMGSEALERHLQQAAHDMSRAAAHGLDSAHRLLSDLAHPAHELYRQARDAVHRLDAEHGREPDQRSENLAAALTIEAHRHGIRRITDVQLNNDASHAYVQDNSILGLPRTASVSVMEAIRTPLEQSSAAWMQVDQAREATFAKEPPRQPAHEHSHGLSR